MSTKLKHKAFTGLVVIAFILIPVIICLAGNANYIYDSLNRLIRVEYGDGRVVEYIYDEVGNLASTSATSPNVAPSVAPITAPIDPIVVGTGVAVSASFNDTNRLDTHTATWQWGDGITTIGTVIEADGSGTVEDSHTYNVPGVYTITLTVTDNYGGAGSAIYHYVVVYDPDGGFVTGGGWINSPVGAYTANPTLTGKANFGFVSQYNKGATVPTGVTEFQFKVADLNFRSETYKWLVVSGARAQYKGTGTINGIGDYGFILTAIDGQITGGGGTDKFRIKIWDKITDTIVYDNMPGASDDANPTTVIGGGSIVIHKQ